MNVGIINDPFNAKLYGFSGTAINKNWKQTGSGLMNRMWEQVKSKNLSNKGINVWVYEENNRLFTGIELENTPPDETRLELKEITLIKYGYYKHIGPYHLIGESISKALDEFNNNGVKACLPYLEIYGHWTEDESKLETELLWSLK